MRVTTGHRVLLGAAAALGLGLQLVAQTNATIVMRSGERRPAQNIGFFDGRMLIVRTSFEEEPRIPVEDVAYIDFGGAPDRQVDVRGGEAVMLRSGRMLRGEVTRIAHTDQNDPRSPYLVTFRTAGGEQQITGNEIGRIYFNGDVAASGVSGTSGRNRGYGGFGSAPSGATRVIAVSPRQRWTATGLNVQSGDRLQFRSSGEIRLNRQGDLVASPDGAQGGQHDPQSPMPQTLVGALIGRIGNAPPFGIGTMTEVQMPATGQLFLGVNDGDLNDNDGSFRVEIRMPY
jgi:hypothetical protein